MKPSTPRYKLPSLDDFLARHPGFAPRRDENAGYFGATVAERLFSELDHGIRSYVVGEELAELIDRTAGIREDEAIFAAFIEALVEDARRLTAMRTRIGKRASLWGVTPIINLNPCAQADRLAGSDACSLVFDTYSTSADFDLVLTPQSQWIANNDPTQVAAYRWTVFIWAMLRCDNFFLFNDQGLTIPVGGYGSARFGINLDELKLLRRSDKALYTLAYGADHRSRRKTLALGQYNFCAECPDIGRFCICDDGEAEQMLSTIKEYSTANLTTGLSTYYIPRPSNLNYLILDMAAYSVERRLVSDERPVRILHCPNHQHFKGTHFLEEAIERLKAEGVAVELRLISGVGNKVILEEMRQADIVADQFLGGTFGYTTIEAMAMGRPVLCYLAHPDLVPDSDACPIINASPDTLLEVLREVIARRADLVAIGERSRDYVEAHFSLEAFAVRLQDLYRETIPGYAAGRQVARGGRVTRLLEKLSGIDDSGLYPPGNVIAPPTSDRLAWARLLVERFPVLRPALRATWNTASLPLRRARETCRIHTPRRVADALRAPGRSLGSLRTSATLVAQRWRQRTANILAVAPATLAGSFVSLAVPSGRGLTELRMRFGRPRSVWGITPIITLRLLSRCDQRLGLASDSFVFSTYSVTSNFDVNLNRFTRWVVDRHPRQFRLFTKCVFAYALLRYDVFNYYFDRGFEPSTTRMGLNESELDALRRAGKQVFVYTYGADVRTRERTLALGKFNFCSECPEKGRFCICDEKQGRANTELVARYATGLLAMGDMCAYVDGHRELHFWPLDVERIGYAGPRDRSDGLLRVAHATNQPWFKGTQHLVTAVERLQADGLAIELVNVSGLPNAEVLKIFATVDLVAEQFLGGFHGYTALEAMAVGKPVISYIRDRARLADADACPIVSATPDELDTVLRDFVAGRYDFEELGARGRRYVEQNYAVDAVASALARMYLECGTFPERIERKFRQACGQ